MASWWRCRAASSVSMNDMSRCCACSHMASNWLVNPPIADTTTSTGLASALTISLRLRRLSMLPTEVPPNFITFIAILFRYYFFIL